MTATRATLLGLLLLTGGLAGCMGDGEDSGEEAEPASEDPLEDANETEQNESVEDLGPTITTTWKNATWEGASGPGFYYCHPPITAVGECDNSVVFTVGSNASAVVAELAWNGDADVYYEVADGNGSTVASDTGSSPLRLEVTEGLPSEEAEWTATAWIDATTPTEIEATFAVSVVEDGEMPRQFGKLGQGQGAGA